MHTYFSVIVGAATVCLTEILPHNGYQRIVTAV